MPVSCELDDAGPGSAPPLRRRGGQLDVRIAIALLLIVISQSLATPLNAGPDEPAHLRRAAALVRGDVLGQESPGVSIRTFDLPAWVGQPDPGCYALQPNQPVACADAPIATGRADLVSTAATNPVWAHLLPGAATLLPGEERTQWLARALHALLPTLLVAVTLTVLRRRSKTIALGATLLAMTPLALFTFAVINPSGWSVAGAIGLWVAGSLVADDDTVWPVVAASWALLVLARNDGLIWGVAVVAILAGVMGRERRALIRAWPARRWIVLAIPVSASVAWSLVVPPTLVPTGALSDGGPFQRFAAVAGRTGMHLTDAIGTLGWLDARMPTTMLLAWWVAIGVLVGAAIVLERKTPVIGALAALATAILLAWLIELSRVGETGLFWQGRYSLPLVLGVPVLLGMGLDESPGRFVERPALTELTAGVRNSRLGAVLGITAVAIWNVTFFQAVRRWGVGQVGSMLPWKWDTYDTLVPLPAVMALHVVASVALCKTLFTDRPAI